MARRERFVNNASTTLNGAINDTVTSVTVTAGSVFPAEGDFRVLVDTEIMLVTARATNVLTVVRGVDGTTAASHSDLATIKAIVSRDNLVTRFNDAIGLDIFNAGANTGNKKPFRILSSAGATLDDTDFTWVNQGTSSIATEANGTLTVTVNETTGDWKLLTRAIPSTPYAIFAHLEFGAGHNFEIANPGTMGIGIRDSSTGRFEIAAVQLGDFIALWRFTNPSTFSANAAVNYSHEFAWNSCWLKLVDDGVDLSAYISQDGVRWHFFGQDVRNTWVATPDQVFWGINPRGPADKTVHLNAWIEGEDNDPQQVFYEVQQTTINTSSGTTQDISMSNGEAVRAAAMHNARTSTNDTSAVHAHSSWSMADNDNVNGSISSGGFSEDGQTTTDSQYMRQGVYCAIAHNEVGITPTARATPSKNGNDLRLTWTTATDSADRLGGFALFGGTGISAYRWAGTPSATVGATYSVTGVPFAPDIVFSHAGRAVGTSGLQLQHHHAGVGFASRNNTQASCVFTDRDNVATTENYNYVSDAWLTSETNETGGTARGWEVTSWNSDGVTLTARGLGMSYSHGFMFLKLGGAGFADVRVIDWPGTTGNTTFAFDFQPRMVIMAFVGATAVNTLTRQDAGMTLSFIDGTTQTCSSCMLSDNVSTSSGYSIISNKAVHVPDPTDGTTLWEADFVEWSSSGMTLNFTTVGSASKAIAIGFK